MNSDNTTVHDLPFMDTDNTTIHDLLFKLYERTSQTLTKEELEYFAGAIEQAEIVATSLQGAISNAAFLIEQESMASVKHHMPDLLWSTMHQLNEAAIAEKHPSATSFNNIIHPHPERDFFVLYHEDES